MRFGYLVDTHGGPYDQPPPGRDRAADFCDELVAEAVAAEEAGFDGVFVPERHARTETMWPQPLLALMAFAMRTERVALGTHVLQPAYYNPAHLAEMVALVDVASRGRLILGVGSGYHPGYFAHFGEPFDQRLGRFLESLDFLDRAFRGERFDWRGRYWTMDGVLVNPRPFQRPGPPLWIGATAEAPALRAARRGAGLVLLGFYTPLEEHRRLVDLYRSECARHGTHPVVSFAVDGLVAATSGEARAAFGPLWVDEVRYYIRFGMLGPAGPIRSIEDATLENLEPSMVLGDPAACAAQVARIGSALELGADDWIVFRSRLPQGPPEARVLESIERFGREVIPLVQAGRGEAA